MPLSDSQVKVEQAGPRRRNVSVGDSLFLVTESVSRGMWDAQGNYSDLD